MPRLLDLSLFGNAGAEGPQGTDGRSRSSVTVLNKTKNLLSGSGLEADRQQSLDRHWSAVHGVGLELPLLDAIDGGSRKRQGALQEFRILHSAVPADQNLQDDSPLLTLGAGGIVEGRLRSEQCPLGEFRETDRLNRGHRRLHRFVAAGFGSH